MKKITNREYKMAGALTLVVGTFLLAVSLGFTGTPKPWPLIALSAMSVLFGLLSLLTKPIRSVLILGPTSLVVVILTFFIAGGELFPKVRIWWYTDNPEAIAALEQPDEAEQPTKPVHADLPIIELPSITNTIGMTLNKIPAGTFTMGSPETEEGRQDDEHQHQVTITQPFYMQTTEVTQGQWKAVMGTESWKGQEWSKYVKEGPSYAASYVSWDDAVAFCKKLSEREGKTYRLPTEAEWEYACRGGTETRWSFGDDEEDLGDYAWYAKNAWDIEHYAHQVGLKKPNAFGLYDMHGNVIEWCHDYYEEHYYKQSPEKDPPGPASGSSRVLRGGSWSDYTRDSRSADRLGGGAVRRDFYDGFRLVRELD
jgi:sulfatase modifying factor 1